MDTSSFWSLSDSEILDEYRSSRNGLTESEATERLAAGRNKALHGKRISSLSMLISQFNNPIVWLLFVSALLSFYLDDSTNATIILIILFMSGFLGFWQERSAADAVSKLLEIIETRTTVLRDGVEKTVSTEQIAVGDVLLLRAGSIIQGDSRVLESHNLLVNESALTGESFPAEKGGTAVAADAPLAKRTSALFMGTHIASGTGKAVVVRTGQETEFGRISARLEQHPPRTGFELGLKRFGNLLLTITAVLVTVVVLINVHFNRSIIDSLLFGLALAVGMTPQLLPAITSVVLAKGAIAMARSEVIVKRLLAIENFGGMDILCLDKTGTLTEGVVELHSALNSLGLPCDEVLRLANINSRLQRGLENPIEFAIQRATVTMQEGVSRLDELPYDFARKRMSVLVGFDSGAMIITKGALENVLQCCSCVQKPDGSTVPIESEREDIHRLFQAWSNEGLRTLGVAIRKLTGDRLNASDENAMTFIGFLTFSDPPKPSATQTIQSLETLGIRLKLVTGDNLPVALAIAKKVGLPHAQTLTGQQIQELSREELSRRAVVTDIFAEIEPYQKERIVLAMKSLNHVVGFLGDGINDAPSLHAADVGISVASAVDVAREAAQVVLLRADLGVLAQGVLEGRRTLANTLKYVFTSISANFGYMLSLALASFFLPFLPLLPSQILLINLLADFPGMALATDSVDPDLISKPRHWDTRTILRFMLTFGATGTCCDLLTFTVLIQILHAAPEEFRTGWFLVSVATGLMIIFSMRTQRLIFLSRPGKLLVVVASAVLIVSICLPLSTLGTTMGFVRPSTPLIVMAIVVTFVYTTAMEISKSCFFRNRPPANHPSRSVQ